MGADEGLMVRTSLVGAKANMSLAKLAGFRAVSFHAFWWPGVTEPREYDMKTLGNVAAASRLRKDTDLRRRYEHARTVCAPGRRAARQLRPVRGQRRDDVPLLHQDHRRQQAEPQPVLGAVPTRPAPTPPPVSYEKALATTYDAIKAVSPKTIVIGGAVSPRGHDNPNASTKSHSPTVFIRDLGAAYRASGREGADHGLVRVPSVRDEFERVAARGHLLQNITINDCDKLIRVLGEVSTTARTSPARRSRSSTTSTGSNRPRRARRGSTRGPSPRGRSPLPPTLQGQRYREAISLAFCQRTVRAMFRYHAFDEVGRAQWQSGVYYVDHG